MARRIPSYCLNNGESLSDRLTSLRDLTAASTDGRPATLTPQQRGYCFEALLRDALHAAGLRPRASYKLDGEQVDGSFVLDGCTFLLEAKWVADELPASTLYAFKGKVEGKLVGTVGFLLSMSGFSADAPDALARGKDINVLLITGSDLEAALAPGGSLKELLRMKLRAAAEEGAVLEPYVVTAVSATVAEPAHTAKILRSPDVLAIVVEGPRDAEIVTGLGNRFLSERGIPARFMVAPAGGVVNGVRVAASFAGQLRGAGRIAMLVDADAPDGARREAELAKQLSDLGHDITVIAVAPTLEEEWLGLTRDEVRDRGGREAVQERVANLETDSLLRLPSFQRFTRLLTR
jgi:hypothetical protein